MSDSRTYWRLCSSCKTELAFGADYYACSVSTCNRKRDPLTFCSVACWEAHVPVLRHRDAWAEQQRAPTRAAWEAEAAEQDVAERRAADRPAPAPAPAPAPRAERRVVGVGAPPARELTLSDQGLPRDVLVVVSKLKAYIRARSGMNTSDTCLEVLSDIIREIADGAIRNAAADGRKTVMDRDF